MSQLRKFATIVSAHTEKTRKVVFTRYQVHTKYKKRLLKKVYILVHDEKELSKVGDCVIIQYCAPISARKCWKIIEIIGGDSDSGAK